MREKGFYIAEREAEEIGFSIALVYIPQEKDFRFLPMLHGSCLYQVIVNHGQERFALYCVIF